MIESWAKERYPEIWAALKEIGMRTPDDTEVPEFKIDRKTK